MPKSAISKIILIIEEKLGEMIEPADWQVFKASKGVGNYNLYQIRNDDIPIVRDTKAVLNMLICAALIYENIHEKYSLWGAAIEKVMVSVYVKDFYHNLSIFRSTNSILTHYLSNLKKYSIAVLIPKLEKYIHEIVSLMTSENLDKLADFFIEKYIILEQYQDDYKKHVSAKKAAIESPKDDFISTLIKKNDQAILSYYGKDQYKEFFTLDVKQDEKKAAIEYYPEKTTDTDEIKNIKFLLNAIIGLKTILDDHESYQNANLLYKITYVPSFIIHLKKLYTSLSSFDYQEVIAEKSLPFTKTIKKYLEMLNDLLEKAACIADRLELDFRIKNGYLLDKIKMLVEKHNQITLELRIATNYVKQKNVYQATRIEFRKNWIEEINTQLGVLNKLVIYKNYTLNNIPKQIIEDIQKYMGAYYDEICMNRNHLKRYQDYLRVAKNSHNTLSSRFLSYFEYIGNVYSLTLHAEFMQTLNNRILYLLNQKKNILAKTSKLLWYEKPSQYIHVAADTLNFKKAIQVAIEEKLAMLTREQIRLNETAVLSKELDKPMIDTEKTSKRIINKLKLNENEIAFFKQVADKYSAEDKEPVKLNSLDIEGLSAESVIFLNEIDELLLNASKPS